MEQSTPTTAPAADPLQTPGEHPAVDASAVDAPADPAVDAPAVDAPVPAGPPGFSERGRMRRRARFLRKARELAYRDLGGLVFNLHRFGQRNDALVIAKLGTLGHIDAELRTLEGALAERQPLTILREAGIAACPRCAAIHGSEDRFCPNCGLAMDRHAERPVAGPPPAPPAPSQPAPTPTAPAPVAATGPPATAPTQTTAPAPAPAPARGSAPAPAPASAAPAQRYAPAPARAPVPARAPAPPAQAPAAPPGRSSIGQPAPTAPPAAPPATTSSPAATPEPDPDQPTLIVRPPGPGA